MVESLTFVTVDSSGDLIEIRLPEAQRELLGRVRKVRANPDHSTRRLLWEAGRESRDLRVSLSSQGLIGRHSTWGKACNDNGPGVGRGHFDCEVGALGCLLAAQLLCVRSHPPGISMHFIPTSLSRVTGGLSEGIHGSIRGEHNPKATCVDGAKDRTYLKVYLTVVC